MIQSLQITYRKKNYLFIFEHDNLPIKFYSDNIMYLFAFKVNLDYYQALGQNVLSYYYKKHTRF